MSLLVGIVLLVVSICIVGIVVRGSGSFVSLSWLGWLFSRASISLSGPALGRPLVLTASLPVNFSSIVASSNLDIIRLRSPLLRLPLSSIVICSCGRLGRCLSWR